MSEDIVDLSQAESDWANAFLQLMGVKTTVAPRMDDDSLDLSLDQMIQPSKPQKKGLFSRLKRLVPKKSTPPKDYINTVSDEQALAETKVLVVQKTFDRLSGKNENVGRVVEKTKPSASDVKKKVKVSEIDENVGVKGYRNRVATPVSKVMENAERLAREGKLSDELANLEKVLKGELAKYEKNLIGEKNEAKTKQRESKIDAIKGRLLALGEIKTSLSDNTFNTLESRIERLQEMDESQRAAILKNNDKLRDVVFQKALDGDASAKDLGLIMSAMSGKALKSAVESLLEKHSGDPGFLGALAEACFNSEPPQELKTFYRNNDSPFKDISLAYVQKSEDGQEFLNSVDEAAANLQPPEDFPDALPQVLFKVGKGRERDDTVQDEDRNRVADMVEDKIRETKRSTAPQSKELLNEATVEKIRRGEELSPNEKEGVENLLKDEADRVRAEQKRILSETREGMETVTSAVEDVIRIALGDAVPDSLKQMAAMYASAKTKAVEAEGQEVTEKDIAVGVSSFVMLRVIAPRFIGSPVGTVVSTVLQCIGNNTDCKKPYHVYNDFIKSKIGEVNTRVVEIAREGALLLAQN